MIRNRQKVYSLIPGLFLLFLLFLGPASQAKTGAASVFKQDDEISRLTKEAAQLESRVAQLRVAIENCRRSITPQSPECYIEISWMRVKVSYQEAEKIALNMEEKARDLRERIEDLRSQQNIIPPPSPQVPTTPPVTTTYPPVPTPPPVNQPATPVSTPAQPSAPAPSSAVRPQNQPQAKIGGLTQKEWNLLMSYQRQMEKMLAEHKEGTEEAKRLRDQIVKLWNKALTGPLTPEQRQKLRIRLPASGRPVGAYRGGSAGIGQTGTQEAPPPPTHFSFPDIPEAYIETGIQQAMDDYAERLVDAVNIDEVDRKWLKYDNAIGVARIGLKVKEKDLPGTAAETFDFIIGKLTLPLTSMNVSVFKSVYSQTTFGALNKFMEDSMRVTGAEFNYNEMTRDMNSAQKTILEWLGWGEMMRESDSQREER
ncbi:MAG: hypothetical protein PHU81_02680 [Acidobacteriota bacterium]|nr:hypothetical protein [Acidobacteriota bacterium]